MSRKPVYRASSKRNPKPHRRLASVQPSGQRGEPDQIALSKSGGGVHFAHRHLGVRDDPPTGAPTRPQSREPKAEPIRPQAHSFAAERVHREAVELRLSVPDIAEQKLGEGIASCGETEDYPNKRTKSERDCNRTLTRGRNGGIRQ